jgi:hypothetical protein|tara:strand:- start:414 stop:767 length:354 start_codon:yes stop_codon:yes gene_type:complete
MSMTRTVKILFGFIIALLIPIVLVIGYMYLAMFNHADPTSPLYALFPRDLPDWLPVDYAIKAGVILALMFVVLLIYMAIAEYRFHKKELQARKQQALNRFFSGSRDMRRSSYDPLND